MAGSRSTDGHDWRRLVLVVCCLVAAATGGTVVASVGSDGLAGSPIDSVLPGEDAADTTTAPSGRLGPVGEGGESQLGSLTPGAQTGAGGDLGIDNETFGSISTEVHFVANASQPTYWRTASYGQYTGTSWARDDDTEPYESPVHDSRGQRIEYNVTLEQQAGALPTPWRPTAVDGIDGDDLGVTADGSIQPTGTVPAGTQFTGVSNAPTTDPAVLRTVDDTTPPAVEQYTQLPSDTPPRLATRTDLITEGADSRYETAVAVKDWLRENKDYSLDAYQRTNHVTDTFVFEMEAGYCEYFATAMATMLRTQDIPTRYAVGYTSGQQTDDGQYQVRGMNAHAWVEVHFDGVGWVQFDPTPGGSRLQRQQQALQAVGEDYQVEDPASPGETFGPEDFNTSDPDDDPEYDVSLNRTPVPGEPVSITVTVPPVDGPALFGVNVSGERAGTVTPGNPTTPSTATVTATVPDTDAFEVDIYRLTPVLSGEPSRNRETDDGWLLARGGVSAPGSRLAGGLAQSGVKPEDNVTYESESVYNETIDVATTPELSIGGEVLPGNEVAVTALVGDVALSNARVFVDGERRGQTDDDGRTTLQLPSRPGPVTLTVAGDRFTGETTVDVPALDLRAESTLPLALPFAPVTVTVTYGEDPAVGVPVELNGETVATTGAAGEATVTLPFASAAELTAAENGISAGTTVDGLLVRLLSVVASVVLLVVGVGSLLVRRGYRSPGAVAGRLRRALGGLARRGSRYVTTALVAVVRHTGRLSGLGAVVGRTVRTLLAALGLSKPGARGGPETAHGATVDEVPYPPAGPADPGDERTAVRAAWGRLIDVAGVSAVTHTPEEVATHAIEQDDLPADAVRVLRDAFRAVEYGARPADLDRVRAAVTDIEAAVEDTPAQSTEGEETDPPGGAGRAHNGEVDG